MRLATESTYCVYGTLLTGCPFRAYPTPYGIDLFLELLSRSACAYTAAIFVSPWLDGCLLLCFVERDEFDRSRAGNASRFGGGGGFCALVPAANFETRFLSVPRADFVKDCLEAFAESGVLQSKAPSGIGLVEFLCTLVLCMF